jgi:YVTN family beta-propeller protein
MAAGIALSADGKGLFVADNIAHSDSKMSSVVKELSVDGNGQDLRSLAVAGYPYAIKAVTTGIEAGKKLYVSCEQGSVYDLDPVSGETKSVIRTGDHPLEMLLNKAQDRLYVANADDDTISVIDTSTDSVIQTILIRPSTVRGLVGATPISMTFSRDEKTLFVVLADYNAVAVVNLATKVTEGYIPVGWYPTAASISADGARLFVANAKGVAARTPNINPTPYEPNSKRSKYIQLILEGDVSTIDLKAALKDLSALTDQTLANNMIAPHPAGSKESKFVNPGIRHIIYIVKENRTYDQVLGDMTEGNGDPSCTLFGRDVTPNHHAIASRFVLFDNFYCCGEVSGDGWVWSTAGMANPYVERNVPYGYTQHNHTYDYEGLNNGIAPDILGVKDVSESGGGYLWDNALKHGLSVRNYGFFSDDHNLPREAADKGAAGLQNQANKKALVKISDPDFREVDLNYTDSDAWLKWGLSPTVKQLKSYGGYNEPSRFNEWKREFDQFVANGNLPQLMFVRLPDDHTVGTSSGAYTPSAMVADNDYSVGEFVDAVSHSPYWKSTAIFVVEDDAQNGSDHVDAHRSAALAISPYIKQGFHDSRFYNTDSVLRTIESLLGLGPMCLYDATAPIMNIFSADAGNDAAYNAVLPDKAIVSQINEQHAYRSDDSIRFFNPLKADAGPADQMNDIIWRSVKGVASSMPAPRHSFLSRSSDKDDDDED